MALIKGIFILLMVSAVSFIIWMMGWAAWSIFKGEESGQDR